MAIKDSVIDQVLKSEATTISSQILYQRLRNMPSNTQQSRGQTEHKPSTNRTQKRTQTEHKLNTNQTQTEHRKQQSDHKLNTELNTEEDTNRTQTEHKPNTENSFSALVGLQRNILLFLFQQSKIIRSRITQELSLFYIADQVKIKLGSVKTTLTRLEEKGFIKRVSFKNGRSGWSKYEIPDSIYNELLYIETANKPSTNRTQTEHKLNTELNTELNTMPLSSSSVLNIKTTTNLNEEFININFDELESVGFTKNHLYQITTRSNLPANLIQESIDAFAFDLKKNNKAASFKKRPLDVFMGLLTKGSVYLPPENYETPQQESMRLFLARKRAIIEKDKKQQEEALELAFEAWSNKKMNQPLIQELISKIEPWMKKNEMVVRAELYSYYKENVWSTEKENFLNYELINKANN